MGQMSELDIVLNHDRALEPQPADHAIGVMLNGLECLLILGASSPEYQGEPIKQARAALVTALAVRFPEILLRAASMTRDMWSADYDQLIQAALDGDTSPRLALTQVLTTLDLI